MTSATARRLRRDQTDAERLLWSRLRRRQLHDYYFRRQAPIGPCIVDFLCKESRLVVEVDGGQHAIRQAEDGKRTAWLADHDYRVIRFWNNEVVENIEGVLDAILTALRDH